MGNPLDFSTPGMLAALPYNFPPLEAGLNEYRQRSLDWNVYQEFAPLSEAAIMSLQKHEASEALVLDNSSFSAIEALKYIPDFVGRLKILFFAEKLLSADGVLGHWLTLGRPGLEFLLIDSVNVDLEAYQKCKILLYLSLNGVHEAIESLLSFLRHCCGLQDKDSVLLATYLLELFLEKPENRDVFICDYFEFAQTLVVTLSNIKSSQAQYQLLLCFWLLTFTRQNASRLTTLSDLVPILMETAKTSVKEKVARIIVSILSNLLQNAREEAIPLFIGSKLAPLLETMISRKYADDEFKNDLEFLNSELGKIIQKLSTFDEYSAEIKSGQLEWTPPHKSELFWKDNAAKLDNNDMELLRLLAEVLHNSIDPQRLAVACSDIGRYVEQHPVGKRNVDRLGIKQDIMKLIAHPDSEVRFYALSAVQKYMSNIWLAL